MLFFNKKENSDEIGFIIDNSFEIHTVKNNKDVVILITSFVRSPNLSCIIRILQDNIDGTSEISKEYKKQIKKDIKNNKQYFLLDNIKYYLKHTVI